MKPRYSFSSHHTRRATDSKGLRKQKQKYPSVLKNLIYQSDIVLQVLDARFPEKTRNLEIEELIKKQKKKIIYVLNKSDLAKKVNRNNLTPSIPVSCVKRRGIKELRDLIKIEAKKIDRDTKKLDEKILVGVIGYPNTGKSSLINILIGKSSAGVGSEAGFTRGIQKLRLTEDIQLLDSPGVIPRAEYSSSEKLALAKHTIVGGRSWTQIKDPELIIDSLMKEFPNILENYYKIKAEGNAEILIEELGKKLNYLGKGGIINEDKVARKILRDWQKGEIRV